MSQSKVGLLNRWFNGEIQLPDKLDEISDILTSGMAPETKADKIIVILEEHVKTIP